MSSLQGKVILVTGASSGIGEQTALELARYHVKLIVTARRQNRLDDLAEKIRSQGSEVEAIPADLTKPNNISALVDKTLKRFGHVDILANIAGWGIYKWFEDFSPEDLAMQYQVNVLGLAELTRQIIPVMQHQKSGHIINMSSYAGLVAFPPMTVYASTKFAIDGLTDGLRRELKPWGIQVSRVHPGSVSGTEFNQKSRERGGVDYKSFPIGRISKEYVARRLVNLMQFPRSYLYLGRIYDLPAFINFYFPNLVDEVAAWWVKRKRNIQS